MPTTSHADVVTDLEELLTNIRNAPDLPDLTVYQAPVEQLLAELKTRGALRKSRIGIKQLETQVLQGLLPQAKDAASRLRSAIKAHFGAKNPRLLEFGMKPLGRRLRREEEAEEPPRPEIPAPAANPEASKP